MAEAAGDPGQVSDVLRSSFFRIAQNRSLRFQP